MNYRQVLLEDNIDISTAATKTFDLDLIDTISRLSFKFNVVNDASTIAIVKHPMACVSKIELVDGSDVLHSLSAKQMAAAMFYNDKMSPQSFISGITSGHSYFDVDLDFGRFLYDPVLAFDPTKFANPQIKITYNKVTNDANSGSMYLSMLAEVFDEKKPSPTGFLMRKEVESWTPASDTHEYVTLPRDYAYRRLFLTGYATDNHVRKQIAEVKLSEDQDKRVPYNINTRTLLPMQMRQFGPVREIFHIVGSTSTEVFYSMASYEAQVNAIPTVSEDLFITTVTGDVVTVDAETGSNRIEGEVFGYVPFHTFPLVFGDQMDLADWYDVSKIGSLKLDVLAGTVGTSPVGCAFLEQLRTY
jgi:hypothetical protein